MNDTRKIFEHLEDAMQALGKAFLDDEENVGKFSVVSGGRPVTWEDVIEWIYAARDHFEEKTQLNN
ncbi:MAG TPA: hypothetical protein VNV43_00265 [Candidatus Acidoferrales bacterium]|nr:hypothetical protein [Candidatus Acidoferrales bacterium]